MAINSPTAGLIRLLSTCRAPSPTDCALMASWVELYRVSSRRQFGWVNLVTAVDPWTYLCVRPSPAVMEDVMGRSAFDPGAKGKKPWNAGRRIGAKRALKPQQVWAIRFWLDHQQRVRDRALFDLAIDMAATLSG